MAGWKITAMFLTTSPVVAEFSVAYMSLSVCILEEMRRSGEDQKKYRKIYTYIYIYIYLHIDYISLFYVAHCLYYHCVCFIFSPLFPCHLPSWKRFVRLQ